MIKKIGVLAVAYFMIACGGGNKEEVLTEQQLVDSLQSYMTKLQDENLEPELIIAYSSKQVDFANKLLTNYDESQHLEKWLFEAGKAGRTSGRFESGIMFFKEFVSRYPNDKRVPEALFLTGFIYDEDLKDKDRAKGCYEQVVKKFPTHDLADDAQALIEQLYMTDEEIIRMIEEKAAQLEAAK
ncbi:MAG: tetratricopeptide repeat protein [Luteibaculum sp.]